MMRRLDFVRVVVRRLVVVGVLLCEEFCITFVFL